MKKILENKYLKEVPAFIFGFLLGQEVFYCFRGSSYYFSILYPIMATIAIGYAVIDIKHFLASFLRIGISIYVFSLFIIISYIPAAINSLTFADFSISLKGTAIFFLMAVLTMFVCALFIDHKKTVLYGLFVALMANLVMSLIVLVVEMCTNYVITLYDLFPMTAFYIPSGGTVLIQGFYREPSHLTSFVVSIFPLLFMHFKDIYRRFLLILCVGLMLVISGSGNWIVFAVSVLFILLLKFKSVIEFIRRIWRKTTGKIVIFCVLGTFLIVSFIVFLIPSLRTVFLAALTSVNPFDSGNSTRLNRFEVGLDVAMRYPFGGGYNFATILISRIHPEVSNAVTHNIFLTRWIETGVLGMAAYVCIFAVPMFRLLSIRKSRPNCIYICASLLAVMVVQFLDGDPFPVHFYVVGVAQSYLVQFLPNKYELSKKGFFTQIKI